MKAKNFRKRSLEADDENEDNEESLGLALEEVKFLQRQREKKSGIPALPIAQRDNSSPSGLNRTTVKIDKGGGEGDVEKDDLVLQDTFAQETAVMVEDPNMLRYVEQELAKKRGKNVDMQNQVENDVKHAEDELYKIPENLKVKRRSSNENSTQWTTGIAEVQLPIEYKLRNIEETEAAKKLLQEKRLSGRGTTESNIPSSFSADYLHRGKEYAEKLRKENPQLNKDKGSSDNNNNNNGPESKQPDSGQDSGAAVRRQAATDQFMLERFRKRERQRLTRR